MVSRGVRKMISPFEFGGALRLIVSNHFAKCVCGFLVHMVESFTEFIQVYSHPQYPGGLVPGPPANTKNLWTLKFLM